MGTSEHELDFIIIGVQKGGTTALWNLLRSHSRIAMPNAKETPLFFLSPEEIPEALDVVVERAAGERDGDVRIGKAATQYMMGLNGTSVETVSERIARFLPGVRLIALLRDPIERAVSHYRMSVRRGFESRDLDAAVEESLRPESLAHAREDPTETNSYLVQGEYARILRFYWKRFPEGQIHVASTAELEHRPGEVLDRVLSFLALPPGYRPDDLGVRYHVGGTRRRLDGAAVAELRSYLDEHVWPRFGDEAKLAKFEFNSFLTLWNVIPEEETPVLSTTTGRTARRCCRAASRHRGSHPGRGSRSSRSRS
jgi:hypothetical protein